MNRKKNLMKVILKNSFGESIPVNVFPEDTIQDLKDRIQNEVGVPLDFNQMNSNGQKFTNEQKVMEYISSGLGLGIVNSSSSLTCIVQGCRNFKSSTSGILFSLPDLKEKREQWLIACKREDLMDNTEHNLTVCSDHFEDEHFSNLSKTRLKEDATPIVQSPCEVENVMEISDVCEEQEAIYIDHCETIIKTEPDYEVYVDEVEDDEKHPGQLCRLCANNTDDVIYIFSSTGKQLNIANKINSSLPIMIQKTDPLPKQLCSSCVLKLDMCFEFSQSCIAAEEKLKSLMELKQFWSQSTEELDTKWQKNSMFKTAAGSQMNGENLDFNHKQNMKANSSENSRHKKLNILKFSQNSYCCPLCSEGKMVVHDKEKPTVTIEIDTEEVSSDKRPESLNNASSSNCKVEVSEGTDDDCTNNVQNNVYEVKDEEGNNYTLVDSNTGWWSNENTLESAEIIIETLNPDDESFLSGMDDESGMPIFLDPMETESCNSVCQICGETFTCEEHCLDHSKDHAEVGCYPCSLCGMIFTSELDITSHCEEHRAEEKKVRSKLAKGRITCSICGRRFNNEKTLNEHSCGTNEAKQFRCEICKKAYISEERLRFHRQFHEGAKPNHCVQCGKEFDNECSLYYHTRMVHEGSRPFCCEQCGKRFYSNARLEAHKRVHSGERPFECQVCGRRFYDRETLKGHYITHMSVKPFQCDLCGVCCGRKSMLKQHVRIHHSDSYMPKRVPSLIHYFCKICNETFTSSSDVLSHRTTHWGTSQNADNESKEPKPHVCEYCGEGFSMVNTLGRHRKQEHPDEQPYVCSICKETSRTLYEARAHRKSHTSTEDVENSKEKVKTEPDKIVTQKVFICEECGKPLPGRRKFMAHMKAHRMDLPFECTACGKKFTEKQRLLVHMRLHTGEKPYSCNECGKRFTQSSALYTHVLLHTGEKPHACDLCGKAFRIKADRDNHRRTHTGEKPYRCEFCGKQFRTGQVYYQHRMIHTGERRFPCDICGKAFKRSHTLVVHKRIHTGEKPNICDICGRGFRQRTDMKKHRALHAA